MVEEVVLKLLDWEQTLVDAMHDFKNECPNDLTEDEYLDGIRNSMEAVLASWDVVHLYAVSAFYNENCSIDIVVSFMLHGSDEWIDGRYTTW